jgi:glutathione S-transferase
MRPWLALTHAGATFETETVDLPDLGRQVKEDDGPLRAGMEADELPARRQKGSVTGLFPVLWVDDTPIHESLAICEWVAETYPRAGLWPDDPLDRARARSVCSEMAAGFFDVRGDLGCHLFARVPPRELRPEVRAQVRRIFEIWSELLERHGGPMLTGRFGIVDCMYYPVVTRFRTYGVALPPELEAYAERLESSPPVCALVERARHAPHIDAYDAYVRSLGGDPDAAIASGAAVGNNS